jgi:K+-sensing histidine kinase KdpD
VARTGASEIVQHAPSGDLSEKFLNVLLHAECLLAVPVARGQAVQGVLVCVDAEDPTAYGPQDLAKAELLASQVAVALDNAYQHDLQRRRLEEVTALYQFAQSAHTALSAPEIAGQLLPILKDRLRYTYAAVWVRDPALGTLRLAVGDSPGGIPLAGVRPSELAARAFSTGEPMHAGLGWSEAGADYLPPRTGIRSQLAVPLTLKRRVIGVVDLESRQANAYSLNDERLLVSLGNHAALAIENLHLLDEARKMEALKELDRMKSDLLSTVSHELRTPLGSIKGYASTMLTH